MRSRAGWPAQIWSKIPKFRTCIFGESVSTWGPEQIRTTNRESQPMSVEQEIVTEELEPDRPWEAHAWLRAETLAALAEFNEQCLEMLALQFAPGATSPVHTFGRETAPILRVMDADARH